MLTNSVPDFEFAGVRTNDLNRGSETIAELYK